MFCPFEPWILRSTHETKKQLKLDVAGHWAGPNKWGKDWGSLLSPPAYNELEKIDVQSPNAQVATIFESFSPRPLTVNSAKIGEIWKKNTSAVKRFTDPVRACFCLINPIGDQNGFNFFQDVARGEIADTRRTHRLKVAKYPRQIISKKHQSITEKWQHVPSRLSKFPGYSWVKLPSKRENYFTNLMKKYVLIFTKKCHD